jgi:transposase
MPGLMLVYLRRNCAYLRKRVRNLKDDLDQLVRRSPLLAEKSALLQGVPGAGPVLCMMLLTRLPELGRLNRAEIWRTMDSPLT